MGDIQKILKEGAIQIGSGGSAGFVEVCIMHPLDLIKTRLQIQSGTVLNKNDPRYYSGILDCMRKMYQSEGLKSFWKGVIPPILAETPKRAVKFFTFEQYKTVFMFGSPTPTPLVTVVNSKSGITSYVTRRSSNVYISQLGGAFPVTVVNSKSGITSYVTRRSSNVYISQLGGAFPTFSLAGLGAGVTEAILVNPFEVVKVTLQSNRATGTEVPNTWAVTKQIVKANGLGLRGLNKGITATIARNGLFNMVYFGFYHSVKGYLPVYEDPMQEFLRKVGIGFTSGTIASFANIPFDVAKSRIQGPQPINGEIKYKSTLGSIGIVYKEEGFRALYKGLLPKVLRLGPGGAIMLLVYEYMHDFLVEKFPN